MRTTITPNSFVLLLTFIIQVRIAQEIQFAADSHLATLILDSESIITGDFGPMKRLPMYRPVTLVKATAQSNGTTAHG